MIKFIGILVTALALSLGVVTGAQAAQATPHQADLVVTATVHNHPDNGHGTPSKWALDTFTRTMRIHETSPGHYVLTTTDRGSFTTIKGAGDPAGHGKQITRTLTGTFRGNGTGDAVGYLVHDAKALSGKVYNDDGGTPFTGVGWVSIFFKTGATVSPFNAYRFVYTTADEQWIDASTNADGTTAAAGDVTGALSSLLTVRRCWAPSTKNWTVTNARGNRSRTFWYHTTYAGVNSTAREGIVPAHASVTLTTAKSTKLTVNYWNGYAVQEHAVGRC